MGVEKPGAVYKLSQVTCRKCFYCTSSHQCAWWEHPHIAREIQKAHKNKKPGIRCCPYYVGKNSPSLVSPCAPFSYGKAAKHYEGEKEDISQIVNEVLGLSPHSL